ncbi:hypothetical protein CAPTEDRAFT_146297 [Capitella teleta]|uniref:Geminin n=1 Tax=Capitella teleta TaxID=283909 RepID=R7VAC1_CAPTE|nr:hypothetical protein CAPTEDRAFT_146297 [Capitella teleta]|eukprot:ELU13276.1 hypothetical protein CAPTEDRAFT_146297 [Capitella teleta]
MTSTPTRTDRYAQCPETEDDCWCPCHHEEQRTAEQEAYELMVQEEITPEYWKLLAEQRREALDETLEENSQLHDEVEKLREENKSLSEMAQNAEYFASILKVCFIS